MASLKETKERIASVKSTLKITSAMKMVASAKLHKAQNAIANMLPYEQKLRSIILQKWIALYPNSTEGWNEIRRTGYPDIKSGVINYAGTSAAALVQSGNTIQRLSYPDNAYDYDMEHIPADYKAGGKCHTYRMQHGVWWSYAGENGTFASTTTPSNF